MIWRLRRKQHFDVVHQLNPVALGMNLCLPVGRTPLVLGPVFLDTMYNAPGGGSGLPSLIKRFMVWQLFHRAARVAGVLPLRYALPQKAAERVRYLGFGGITPEDFPWYERPTRSSALTILFLANLREHKGIYDLLEAYKLVLAQMPHTRLMIAGDGPENRRVSELVRSLPSPAQVTLLGSIPRDSIAAVYREADVYCLPSHLEPFGMSALEAMASGLPIVATTVGGLQQIVESEGGLLVPPKSPAALANALLHLLRDPAMRQRMATHNRKVV
jgi:glycosyltransferase involved in cell wall biosynthesis